jgi:hypothetical protein
MKPPEKETGAMLHAPIPKLRVIKTTRSFKPAQGWHREAARLLSEYVRCGNPKHLVAFVVHVIGMRTHAGGHTQ